MAVGFLRIGQKKAAGKKPAASNTAGKMVRGAVPAYGAGTVMPGCGKRPALER